jgi:hypothetical protein
MLLSLWFVRTTWKLTSSKELNSFVGSARSKRIALSPIVGDAVAVGFAMHDEKSKRNKILADGYKNFIAATLSCSACL